ncbi:Replication initiator protein A, N-terminal domain protein [Staphylococcus capitis]|nr:Replication initiator protein A, N-terminal domain protein [Staphylococcus capitis]
MSNFKRISIQDFEKERFYKLYKFLFEDEYFKKMSDSSKIAYCMFRDRFELSKMNNWIDENGNVYLIFTTKDLCELLNCGTQKVTKIKKELEKFNLLEQERIGLNKPNRIYILEPNTPNKTSSGKEFRKSKFQSSENQNSRNSKIENQEARKSKSNDTEFNDTEFNDTESNDTNDMYDKKNELNKETGQDNTISSHSNHPNHLTESQDEFNEQKTKQDMLLQNLPEAIQLSLKYFSNKEIRCIKAVMNKAKANYNKNVPVEERITYETCAFEIGSALKRIKLLSRQKNEDVCNLEAYMMQSFRRVFKDYIQDQYRGQWDKNEDLTNENTISDFEPANDLQAMAKRMFLS